MRLFFDQRLVTNGFTNNGPRRLPTAYLGRLIEDVRRTKLLELVTMPRQWRNQYTGKIGQTNRERVLGIMCKQIVFGAVQMPKGLDPYSPPTENGIRYQKPQGKGWQVSNPEHCHPVSIKFKARYLQKYATPYFSKVLIVGNKTVRYFPKYGGNLQGERDMCMHHIL